MRIKIGDKWYSQEDGVPMMVEFSNESEKRFVANMQKDSFLYAIVPDSMTVKAAKKWMKDGSKHA